MPTPKNTPDVSFGEEPEFESANAGWDPYVAALIGGTTIPATTVTHEERRTQVMSMTRRFASAFHRRK